MVRRFGALVLDWILCLLVSGTFSRPALQPWTPVVVLILEYGFFIGLFAVTPGMWITKLRCIAYPSGGAVGIPRALLRGFLLALVVPTLIMDPERRGLHDRAAGTIVVTLPS